MSLRPSLTICIRMCGTKFWPTRACYSQFGPLLGRPRVDTLDESRHRNMKELRFDAAVGVWRVAFAFDPNRRAILLLAGTSWAEAKDDFISSSSPRQIDDLTLISPGSNTREGSNHAEERERYHQQTNPRATQESRGSRRPAHCRGNDAARTPPRAQDYTAEDRKIPQYRPGRRLEDRKTQRPSDFHSPQVTVEAMGGSLSLVAEFPDRDPFVLSGIAEDEPTKPTTQHTHRHSLGLSRAR